MTQPHTILAATPVAVLDVVARAVLGDLGEPIETDAAAPVESCADLVTELVAAAAANARRLAIAARFWVTGESLPANLARIMADAVNRGIATSAAVNVAGAMVGAAAAGSEEELVMQVVAARRVLADEDLIAGAAALMLALAGEIARALALDPVTVEFELRQPAA